MLFFSLMFIIFAQKITYMTEFGALFDLDGVLIDTENTYTRFWDEIDSIYPTGIKNYALHIKGTTLEEIMKDFPDPDVQADILRRIRQFQDTMTYPIFPGVEDFLRELVLRGIPVAIVTSSDDRKMNFLFKEHPDFRHYFKTVVDASQVTLSKPNPQGYLLAAKAIGRCPENCFVFEDSIQGLKAGRAAGATVIGLATTNPRQAVEPLADIVIDGFTGFGVDDMLRAFNRP